MLGARLEVSARLGKTLPKTRMVLDQVDRCGIYPFVLPLYHPFTPACEIHDREYVDQKKPRAQVDKELLENFQDIARDSIGLAREQLIREAKFYYRLARLFGGIPWKLRKWGLMK